MNLPAKTNLIIELYQAFSDRDLQKLKVICDEKIAWYQLTGFPGGKTSIGIQEIITNVYEGNASRWKSFRFKRDSIQEMNDIVLVEGNYFVKGEKNNHEVAVKTAHLFRIKNNKVISFQQYTDSKLLWDNLN